MSGNDFYNSFIPFIKKPVLILLFVLLNPLIIANPVLYAQSSNENIHLTYKNRLLTISVKSADIKDILLKLSEKTNTHVTFPESLKGQITINKKEVTFREVLKSLLKGLNYAIIYSATNNNKVTISEVRVFSASQKSRPSERAEARITRRFRAYERQIESLRDKLSSVDVNSRRGKSYLNRIQRIEEMIRKLETQSN